MIGDSETAEQELEAAINHCRESRTSDELNNFEKLWFSRCLELMATIRHDKKLFQKAIELLDDLVAEDGWTEYGLAELYRNQGDCFKHAGQWKEAHSSYKKAISIVDLPIYRVLLCVILVHLRKANEASDLISGIDQDKLDPFELNDFVFAYSAIAIETGELDQLKEAKNLLENRKMAEPYFEQRRLKLLIGVQSTIKDGRSETAAQAARSLLSAMARSASKYLMLQPNFMGVGINVNSILDDIAKNSHEKIMLDEIEPNSSEND
ncbi:MAG: hypothetical protein QGH73_15990 [Rhodospirillales bacterium]|nr:hypothetical protein [Rhodospirillales bacterium]